MAPFARRDLPAASIVLRGAEVSFRPRRGSAAPAHHRALCKKRFQLAWDWVVLFCFPANWVSGTGGTGQSGLGLAASWGCGRAGGRADRAGSGKGQRISLPSRPSPASGPPAPTQSSAPSSLSSCRRPKGVPDSLNLLPAVDSTGEAPAEDKMGGVSCPKGPPPRYVNTSVVSPAAGWPTPSSHTHTF